MASTVYKSYREVALSSTALLVNTGSCVLVGWNLINPNTSNVYVKLYNSVSNPDPVMGDTPVRTLLVPASGTVFLSNEDKFQLNFPLGMWVVCVTGIADDDVAAPVTGCYTEILYDSSPNN